MKLFMQYFRNGLVVADKNLKCRLKRIKLVMFQLIMNIPMDIPTIAAPNQFTLPRYSGARNKESAPKDLMKVPLIVLKSMNQKTNRTWYFLKCRNKSCMGKE